MFETIIDFIGNLLSSIFGRFADFIEDRKVSLNMMKEQVSQTKTQTTSTLSVSISENSHVNYFRNRVIGEFLKVIVSLIPFKYDCESNKYVSYFVRRKNRSTMEYIKFSKNKENDTDADVSYTYINKVISKTGVTTNIGNTSQTVLLVTDVVSNCIYDAISGYKSPLYLCNVLDDAVNIGNPTFIIDCWVLMVRAINISVSRYFSDNSSIEHKKVNILMEQAGMHMFMSYFKSIKNPFYRELYKQSSISSISEAIKVYNSLHFNTNKIVGFSFKENSSNSCSIEYSDNDKFTFINAYGITLKVTGIIRDTKETVFKRFNHKLSESILKSNDHALVRNFVSYVLSTGGIELEDINTILTEEDYINNNQDSYQDTSMSNMNDSIEQAVDKVMEDSNFKEDENGDLVSIDFKSFIDTDVKTKVKSKQTVIPKEDSPIIVLRNDNRVVNNNSIPIVKHDDSNEDIVRKLHSMTTGKESNLERPEISEKSVKYVSQCITKPLVQWSLDECKEALEYNYIFDSDINRSDVIDRMLFLSRNSK